MKDLVTEDQAVSAAVEVLMNIGSVSFQTNVNMSALLTHLIAALGEMNTRQGGSLEDWKARVTDVVQNKSHFKLMKVEGSA